MGSIKIGGSKRSGGNAVAAAPPTRPNGPRTFGTTEKIGIHPDMSEDTSPPPVAGESDRAATTMEQPAASSIPPKGILLGDTVWYWRSKSVTENGLVKSVLYPCVGTLFEPDRIAGPKGQKTWTVRVVYTPQGEPVNRVGVPYSSGPQEFCWSERSESILRRGTNATQ